ncbi:AraC family transcriptional regulator, arabinose operon regulatory protein [Cohnella sp. OV330]|uniref:helix-turn-helix domain-containing protein n=1 Tax=Cohnella sp. OV330 TaxID=1855288 RepID=UPI0008EA53D9|nr:AraC family transcriptional regulator [Cohnella sp. OV330]SFB34203.1 AraC family transcriptional regulator, arabinose operon regulatory protein [Cohnella sp. OV330]
METEIFYSGYVYHGKPVHNEIWHTSEYYLVRLQTEGSCAIEIDGVAERLYPGDFLLLRPGEHYRLILENDEHGKTGSGDFYAICKGTWIDRWASRGYKPKRARIHPDSTLLDIWKLVVLERRRIGDTNAELVDCLLRALLLAIESALKQGMEGNARAGVAYRMKRYIEEHATRTITIEEVAASVRHSPSRAAKLFKEAFGETIVQFAMRVRMSIAIERMQYSALSLEQIAESCGFGSYPYFYRCFMKRFGVSPRQYREQYGDFATDV